MKIALSQYGDKIATACDFADTLSVVELASGARHTLDLCGLVLPARAAAMADAGIELLICGAISRNLEAMLYYSGIEVISGVTGGCNEILSAYRNGNLENARYRLPGCRQCRRRRRCHF